VVRGGNNKSCMWVAAAMAALFSSVKREGVRIAVIVVIDGEASEALADVKAGIRRRDRRAVAVPHTGGLHPRVRWHLQEPHA